MTALHEQKCEACQIGATCISDDEQARLLPELPGWQVIDVDGIKQLQKVFRFRDFVEALAFTQQVGELAERFDHHPALLTEWGKVTVSWWTHKIQGLHKTDFILAAKTDQLQPL